MRRSIVFALPVLALSALLAACGDADDSSSSPTMHSSTTMMNGDMGDGSMGGGMDHGSSSPVVDGARRIEVSATSFDFTPETITVRVGEDIAIALTAGDLLHDFTIDELDAHVAADKGETAEGGLRADEPGEYTYYCSVAGHREAGMEGTLIVRAA
jgi:cytochrome c oxidase subunit II